MAHDQTHTETTHTESTEPTRTEHTVPTRTGTTGTLGDVSHTNPYTDAAFGSTQVYDRGKVVAADGGEAAGDADGDGPADPDAPGGRGTDEDDEDERLEDVDHTPPKNAESVNRVHERGNEGRDETV